jgi:hypothetical protein
MNIIECQASGLEDQEKALLLECIMRDIRGNWSDPGDRIRKIEQLCGEIVSVPKQLLDAIKKNAETFDGEFNDGRIFRDGQMFLPEGSVESMGFPEGMKGGVSGNMAALLGARPVARAGGFRGTYEEIVQFIGISRKKSERSKEFMAAFDEFITYPEHLLE